MASSECKTTTLVEWKKEGNVATLTLNNPAKKNALSKDMIKELLHQLRSIAEDDSQRAVVIKGADGIFCSGADLEWMKAGINQSMSENMNDASLFYKMYNTLYHFPKPVIVFIEQFAFGGATGFAACADYTIATKETQFGFPEVRLGLVPGTIAPFIVKRIGFTQSKELMLSGITFSSKKAKKIGLVNEVCEASEAQERIDSYLKNVLKNGPEAISTTKHLLNRIVDNENSQDEISQICCHSIASARLSEEGQEGVKAFFNKTKPNWNKD